MTSSLGNSLTKALYELSARKESQDYIRNHPGDTYDIVRSVHARIAKHPHFEGKADDQELVRLLEAQFEKASPLCESPIERNILAGLITANWFFCPKPFVPVFDTKDMAGGIPHAPVVILPQFPIARYRLDFALLVRTESGGRILGIECDGRDFHFAPEDAVRDRNLASCGVLTVRIKGSDLFRSPTEQADRIVSMAAELSRK